MHNAAYGVPYLSSQYSNQYHAFSFIATHVATAPLSSPISSPSTGEAAYSYTATAASWLIWHPPSSPPAHHPPFMVGLARKLRAEARPSTDARAAFVRLRQALPRHGDTHHTESHVVAEIVGDGLRSSSSSLLSPGGGGSNSPSSMYVII